MEYINDKCEKDYFDEKKNDYNNYQKIQEELYGKKLNMK